MGKTPTKKNKVARQSSQLPNGLKVLGTSTIARQGVFGFFWGLGHFVDAFRQPSVMAEANLESAAHVIVFGLAVWLMMKPTSTTRIALLAAFNVLEAVLAMPIMPNHKMIFFMADSAILLSVAVFAFSNRRLLSEWFAASEPFLRLALFVTYGSATFAKLNSGWFNLELSCAVTMPEREFQFIDDITGFEIPWSTFWLMPFFVAGAEMLIWLTVLIPKIRPYTLVLAVLFHLSLSLTPVSQGLGFSFLLFPLLLLYLTDSAHHDIYRRGTRFIELLKRKNLIIPGSYLMIGFAIFMGYISLLSPEPNDREVQSFIRYIPALILLATLGATIIWFSMKHRNAEQVKPAIGIPSVAHLILALLVVANSVAPYIGIKTYATMTMYSNLQMENGKSNHLVIPRIPVDMMVDDQVQVLESSNRDLVNMYSAGFSLTWHEFQRYMSEDPWASVKFMHNGQTFDLDHAIDMPELVELNPLHRITGFRYVTKDPICLW